MAQAIGGNRKLGRATRDAYGDFLIEFGEKRPEIVCFDGDLATSTRSDKFGAKWPERFFNVGIAEANMVGCAAGAAAAGKLCYISSFAVFLLAKGFDQIRMTVAYPGEKNVKMIGTHGGITLGADGASQMSIEDFALAISLPGVAVVNPADEYSARVLLDQSLDYDAPMYYRLGREKAPIVYGEKPDVKIGRAETLREGGDLTIIGTGFLLGAALDAAEHLASEGVEARVLDVHTLRPLDRDAIVKAARETGAIVVAEEHLKNCGLGTLVAQVVAETEPVPMAFVGLEDYAESGTAEQLLEKYGLTAGDVVAAAKQVLARKR